MKTRDVPTTIYVNGVEYHTNEDMEEANIHVILDPLFKGSLNDDDDNNDADVVVLPVVAH